MNQKAVAGDVDDVHNNGGHHGYLQQGITAEEGDKGYICGLYNGKKAYVA